MKGLYILIILCLGHSALAYSSKGGVKDTYVQEEDETIDIESLSHADEIPYEQTPHHSYYRYECFGQEGFVPHQTNCSRYIVCHSGHGIDRRCPPGMKFDIYRGCKRRNVTCFRPPISTPFGLHCPRKDGTFQYQGSCHTYIFCKDGKPELKECPEGWTFFPNSGCVYGNDQCKNGHGQVKQGHHNKKLIKLPHSSSVCPEPTGMFPYPGSDPEHCKKFIVCHDGHTVERRCPSGYLFHSQIKRCLKPEDSDCGKQYSENADPRLPEGFFCKKRNENYALPYTCRKYIKCRRYKPRIMDCPEGYTFVQNAGCIYGDYPCNMVAEQSAAF